MFSTFILSVFFPPETKKNGPKWIEFRHQNLKTDQRWIRKEWQNKKGCTETLLNCFGSVYCVGIFVDLSFFSPACNELLNQIHFEYFKMMSNDVSLLLSSILTLNFYFRMTMTMMTPFRSVSSQIQQQQQEQSWKL